MLRKLKTLLFSATIALTSVVTYAVDDVYLTEEEYLQKRILKTMQLDSQRLEAEIERYKAQANKNKTETEVEKAKRGEGQSRSDSNPSVGATSVTSSAASRESIPQVDRIDGYNAIFNYLGGDVVVKVGGSIGGYEVTRVQNPYVILAKDGVHYTQNMAE